MMAAFVEIAVLASAILACMHARRRPEHRPIAWLLSTLTVWHWAVQGFEVRVLPLLRAELGVGPWSGWARAVGHVADALWLSADAVFVAVALVVFMGRRPWPAFLGWGGMVTALVILHPNAEDGSLGRMLLAAEVLVDVVLIGLLVAGYQRYRRLTEPPSSAQFVLALLVLYQIAALFGVLYAGPIESLHVLQPAAVTVFGFIAFIQGRMLWTKQPSLPG